MSQILLICRKELKSYFASPIAYLLMTAFALLFGYVFVRATGDFVRFSFQQQFQGGAQPMNINDQIITPLLSFTSTITLFLVPMITMRLFAEEKKSGTIELLMTSPVTDNEVILGKWLGAVVLFAGILALSMIDIALLFAWGKPDIRPVLVAYLGLLLQGGCLLAIGEFISSLTKNQIVAGGVTFFVLLFDWLLNWGSSFDTGLWPTIANFLSIVTHFDNMSKGLIEIKDIVFYVSMIFFSLFLTSRSMESLRWRS
ncbi:MAG TPA: ABC transporter permease [Bryobacteraceae bacterium]|jgi:ABC-2 type transport system permease protein